MEMEIHPFVFSHPVQVELGKFGKDTVQVFRFRFRFRFRFPSFINFPLTIQFPALLYTRSLRHCCGHCYGDENRLMALDYEVYRRNNHRIVPRHTS
jgi:hypothetical protein